MLGISVEEQIKMLIELQELDSEIFAKKRILDAIPEKIKTLESELEEKSTNLKKVEEETKGLHVKRKEKEVELQTKEETIKKYQTQLYQVKTNQEYSSLEKEIASTKADSSVLEEEIIAILDQTEELQKKIADEKKLVETEKNKVAEEKKKLEAEKAANQKGLDDLSLKRREFVVKVNKSILSKYERILENKDGLALVPVVGEKCGGCNMNLPPQVANEAKLKKDFTFCGNCSRILYLE